MDARTLKEQIDAAPLTSRADLTKLYMFVTVGDDFLPEYEAHAVGASTYRELFDAIYADEALKDTMVWAECAKLNRHNWLRYFTPKLLIENLRMKTDGLPVQMGEAVMLAPTASRDNIANLYVFENGAFNRAAAEFVTSIGGKFTVADYEFLGIYGLYKYKQNVIMEEWDAQAEPVHNPRH